MCECVCLSCVVWTRAFTPSRHPPTHTPTTHKQLVDRLDQGAFSAVAGAGGQMTYQGLYRLVAKALYRTHVEGRLKAEIIQVCVCGCVCVWGGGGG